MSTPYPQQPRDNLRLPTCPDSPRSTRPDNLSIGGIRLRRRDLRLGYAPSLAPVTRKVNCIDHFRVSVGWTLIGLTAGHVAGLCELACPILTWSGKEIIGFLSALRPDVYWAPVNFAAAFIGIAGATGTPSNGSSTGSGILLNTSPHVMF